MALSYNLGYQESISVHPTRRQNFAGKPYSNFPNIWEWLLPAAPWGILSHLRTLKNCQTCIHIGFSFIRKMFSTEQMNIQHTGYFLPYFPSVWQIFSWIRTFFDKLTNPIKSTMKGEHSTGVWKRLFIQLGLTSSLVKARLKSSRL